MYEHIAVFYEPITLIKWLYLTSPIIAYFLYRLVKLSPIKGVELISGIIYCLSATVANYGITAKLIPFGGAVSGIYIAMLYIFEAISLLKIRDNLWQKTLLYSKKTRQILENYPATSAGILIFFFLFPATFHSFDVTDAGYHLS